MDTAGHIGQVRYHMARLGFLDTDNFDIDGMKEHLGALDAPQELIDYVVDNARSEDRGWATYTSPHHKRVHEFLISKREEA